MKKWLAWICCGLAAVTLTACGSQNSLGNSLSTNNSSESERESSGVSGVTHTHKDDDNNGFCDVCDIITLKSGVVWMAVESAPLYERIECINESNSLYW